MDPFDLLGVSRSATTAEVKSAYRKMAKIVHPDKAIPLLRPQAEEKFKELTEAYEQVLAHVSDPKKKRRGLYGERPEKQRRPPAPPRLVRQLVNLSVGRNLRKESHGVFTGFVTLTNDMKLFGGVLFVMAFADTGEVLAGELTMLRAEIHVDAGTMEGSVLTHSDGGVTLMLMVR